jgi:hypothetical protein
MKKIYLALFFIILAFSFKAQTIGGSINCSPVLCAISCKNPTVVLAYLPTPFTTTFQVISWSNNSSTGPSATYSVPGSQTLTVMTGTNTFKFYKTIAVDQMPPSFTLNPTPPTCSTCCDGALNVAAFPGGLTYTLNGVAQGSANTYTGLCAGKKVVCAEGSNGCIKCDSLDLNFSAVSVKKNSPFSTLKIFPNPVSGKELYFENAGHVPLEIEIKDLTGKAVMDKTVIVGNKINIESLKEGVYLIQVNSHEGFTKKKLVVLRN